ncbi:hypothetical protein B4096_2358 [Heyndrickxia coagulans]|uniref:Uncharacterized protein n=1 Tax=Heyndrickxia coagulans TaxID=1398 RepID=A0A150KDR9_HEYCO|nr:hypothetical protein BCO26_2158 [Heyndrickxia coagulans 2-6]KYC67512.1 hypothetical protein B4099_2390 [Heyndrickxia coagulans]KYC90760.1 hypothetical protein B4096_2358 [Heyndrickxia coagulans]
MGIGIWHWIFTRGLQEGSKKKHSPIPFLPQKKGDITFSLTVSLPLPSENPLGKSSNG